MRTGALVSCSIFSTSFAASLNPTSIEASQSLPGRGKKIGISHRNPAFVGFPASRRRSSLKDLNRLLSSSSFSPSSILAPTTFPSRRTPVLPSILQHQMKPVTQAIMVNVPPKSVYKRQLPSNLTDLKSAEGKARFSAALAKGDAEAFFPLVSQFQTQSHPALCGLTTLTTVLNALEIDPKRVWSHPWRWFAESLLDCCLDMEKVKVKGITMDQLACTAGCQGSVVNTSRGLDLLQARELIKRSVRGRPDGSFEFLVASYDRRTLGQTGSGHFSPIAAYDEETDSALVLDTARFKYGPHWIPLSTLVEATKPIDTSSGLPRGFMTFRKASSTEPASPLWEKCENDNCNKSQLVSA